MLHTLPLYYLPNMMKSLDAHLRNMAMALTDDGDNIFNRETRHFPPIQYLLPSKRWLRQKYVSCVVPVIKRPYADGYCVPPHYVIMDTGCLTPLSEEELSVAIKVNRHQIGVPMKLFFRQNDMSICSQWEFIRHYYLYVPEVVKKEESMVKALCAALDNGWYGEMVSLFYDLKKENPDEFHRRLQSYIEREKELKRQMDECQDLIRVVRINKEFGWNDRWDELYDLFSETSKYKDKDFFRFCKYHFEEDDRMWAIFWDIRRAGTDAWKIARTSAKYFELKSKYKQTQYDKKSFLMYYTLEF